MTVTEQLVMIANEHSLQAILDEAASVWFSSRKSYRDGLLKVGALIHVYILGGLRAGDEVGEACRKRQGLHRDALVSTVATKLKVTHRRINEIVQVAMVVQLLGGSACAGLLPWRCLKVFRPLVKRGRLQRQAVNRGRGTDTDKAPVSSREVWVLRDGYTQTGPRLFCKAVAEDWPLSRCRDEVGRLLGKWSTGNGNSLPPDLHPDDRGRQTRAEELTSFARLATPKDLADLIGLLVGQSQDPKVSARLVYNSMRAVLGVGDD